MKLRLLSLVVLCLLACTKKAGPPAKPQEPTPHPKLEARTEEEWIVSEVARNIAVWRLGAPESSVAVSLERATAGTAGPAYKVRIGARTTTLDFKEYIWSAETFSALIPSATTPPAACDANELLKQLLTPTVAELTHLDEEISGQLKKDPNDPCLHEEAALLLGAFEMREVWSQFLDQRPVLNRMAAHLAIARAGRGGAEPGAGGRIADLMLRSIAWRHDGFREMLRERAASAAEPEKTWLRVIDLWAVQDWRQLPNPTKATLAERTAYLAALSNKTDSSHVNDFLEHGASEDVADWPRLAFQRGASVETCGQYGDRAAERSLEEAEEAYKLTLGRSVEREQLVAALNEEARDRRIGRVLGWPLWAAFEQRSLMLVLMAQEYCISGLYGVPQAGVELRASLDLRFGSLTVYPLLLRHTAKTPAEYQRAVAGSVKLAKERPELVNWCSWTFTSDPSKLGPPPEDLPAEQEWFSPRLPYGTAFDYNMRQWNRHGQRSYTVELLDEARKHVYHALVRRLFADAKYHNHPPLAELKELYGPIAEYDRDAILSLVSAARDTDPAEFKSAAHALCDLSADDCMVLADYLKDHGEPDEAARIYQRWVDGARQRVRVANGVEWLVNYYFDHGQKDSAFAVARMAADVASASGLGTMGKLQERLGHNDEAVRYFRRIQQRYDDPREMVAFLMRHKAEGRNAAALDEILADAFPHGQEPFQNSGFGAARPEGAFVETLPGKKDDVGLAVGDTIVACDGVRIRTLKQFRIQRRLAADERVKLAYWRAAKVVEAEVRRAALDEYRYADDLP